MPKPVLATQQIWRRQMEAQPTRFFSRVFPGAVREAAAVLRSLALRPLVDARTDRPVQELEGALWLRLSAAAYNERADYERLADIVAGALHE